LKIVFMGTGEFAVPILEAVQRAGHLISLVVSQPDRPQGRGLELRKTPVKAAAEELGLAVFQPEKLRLEPDQVIAVGADALVVVAYGQILRENILGCAGFGAINVHASLLPKYRGAAPIQWAIANGETSTGVTTMQLDRGMDTGPILLQEECRIEPDDTTATLEPRLAARGARLLVETLEGLARGSISSRPQDDASSTRAPLIRKSDGLVDFSRPASELVNRLRAFSPWPGAYFTQGERSIKILAARALEGVRPNPDLRPGTIVSIAREGLDVGCGSLSTLRLERVQPESRRPVSGFDFANGAKLSVGGVLGAAALNHKGSGPSETQD
jgi:methionyl-tRNA formyltransferase